MKVEEERIRTICDTFLRKPITRADLLNVLARFLKHSTETSAERSKPMQDEPFCDLVGLDSQDPEGLMLRLVKELSPMWNEVKDSVVVNQVLEFAEKTIAIANIHKDSQLAAWGDKLRNDAMLFDITGMAETLALFPKFMARKIGRPAL